MKHTRRNTGNRLLTRREREVAGLMADGLTAIEISRELVISRHTVYVHERNIKRKVHEPTRGRAAAKLQGLGC